MSYVWLGAWDNNTSLYSFFKFTPEGALVERIETPESFNLVICWANGSLWSSGDDAYSVRRHAADGTVTETYDLSADLFSYLTALAIDPSGYIWGADSFQNLYKFDGTTLLNTWDVPNSDGFEPLGLQFDPFDSDTLWMAYDGFSSSQIFAKFSVISETVTNWYTFSATYDSGHGVMPFGIGAVGDGTVWVFNNSGGGRDVVHVDPAADTVISFLDVNVFDAYGTAWASFQYEADEVVGGFTAGLRIRQRQVGAY